MNDAGHRRRILIYSHDSFGLGHLRRCRTIAQALVAGDPGASVLILSGSPIAGRFEFGERVDFVGIPGVIKLSNGEYVSRRGGTGIARTVAMRAAIIRQTAATFAPDLFIVDKEPLGLRGEVRETLHDLHARGCFLALGLRDVLDDPAALAREWARKGAAPALRDLYDAIWIYGLARIYHPLAGLDLPQSVADKTAFTGYLRRGLPRDTSDPAEIAGTAGAKDFGNGDFILVTPGGGGDGARLVDWVLRAYESGRALPQRAIVVLGPFMAARRRREFGDRAAKLAAVDILTFDAEIERLMARAAAIVAMGGYNTFCEILSFDKPALLVPRTAPRREQLIRARRARDLGLAAVLENGGVAPAQIMVDALRGLAGRPLPSTRTLAGLLDGSDNLVRLARRAMAAPSAGPPFRPPRLRAVAGRRR